MSLSPEDQFLMGGGGAPSAFTKHDGVGTRRGGQIVERPELRQQTDFKTGDPLTWPDGNPRMQLVVTVQTELRDPTNPDDDGRRRIFIKGNLQRAVRDAVTSVGAKGLEVGGSLFVTRTGQEAPKQRGEDGAWIYAAEYVPAAQNYLAQPEPQAQQAAPAQPVQQQAPVTQMPQQQAPQQPAGDPALEAALAHLTPEQQAAVRAIPGVNAQMVQAMYPQAG